MNWNFFRFAWLGILLVSCTQTLPNGPVQMMVIQPVGPSCQYRIAPAPLQTLENLSELRGLVGKVVMSPQDIDANPDILELGVGFERLDLRFSGSGGVYGPLDKSTLLAVSLYYAVETGYLLFKNLDVSSDMAQLSRNLRDTFIVQNAQLTTAQDSGKKYGDNAAYIQIDGSSGPLDYFLAFPNNEITQIPLGFNSGVMIHEYTHMVAQYLFHKKRSEAGKDLSVESENLLAALEEGLADYFGYLGTRDPGFFHCSFRKLGNRDLSQPKVLTSIQNDSVRATSGFDSHDIGAVWASTFYQVGEVIGHTEMGKSLIQYMGNLASCTGLSSSSVQLSMRGLTSCQIQALGNKATSQVQQIYQNAFRAAGGF